MRLTSFIVSRSWASNRLRTLLTILGVALGVAIVVAIHVVDHNTIQSRLRQLRPDSGRLDFELSARDPKRTPEQHRADLTGRPEVRDVCLLLQAGLLVGGTGGTSGLAPLFGIWPMPSPAFQHYRVEAGEDLSDLDGEEKVLVSRALAEDLKLGIGAKIRIEVPHVVPGTRCRDGERVAVEPENAAVVPSREVQIKGILAYERLGRKNSGRVVVGSFALARMLGSVSAPSYQVNLVAGANTDRAKEAFERDFQVLDARSAMLGEGADERAFRNGVKILGCLALVLGMFVVFQTLSQSLVERLRQIGLLRCLGASRSAVVMVFVLDASVLAVSGTLLGIAFGIGLAWLLQSLKMSTLGLGKTIEVFEIPFGPLLWTGALGILFTLAGAAFPLWKARNVSPLDVLANRGIEAGSSADVLRGVNVFLFVLLVLVLPVAYLAMTPLLAERSRETLIVLLELGALLVLFGALLLASPVVVRGLGKLVLVPLSWFLRLPCFLVDKALRRSGGRFAASVCGLAVVLVALLALRHITAALRGEAVAFADAAMHQRGYLESARPLTATELAGVAEVPGVTRVIPFEGAVEPGFQLYGIGVAQLTRSGGMLEQNPGEVRDYQSTRSVIVSRRLALLRQVQVGDVLRVPTDAGEVPYRVLRIGDGEGFFPDERAFAIADPEWLRRDFCVGTAPVRKVAVELRSQAEWPAVRETIRTKHPEFVWAKDRAELLDYALRDVGKDFQLFDVLLAMILGLAGVGLLNAMSIAAMGRTRELGVLRALGATTAALRSTFLVEGALTGMVSAVLALGLGLPLGALIIAGLNRVSGLEAPHVVPWFWVAVTPVLALVLGTCAAVLPSLRAVRESPAEAVRYE